MATQDPEYAKLSAGGVTTFFGLRLSNASLWLAADHLLQLKLSFDNRETSQRFYFRDIQALILVQTNRWQMGNVILGILTGLLAFIAALTYFNENSTDALGSVVALLIATGLFGLIFFVNLVSGSTCACYLKTAVRQEQLSSLSRLRRARKAILRLQPLIEQAQGTLSPEVMAAQFQTRRQELTLTQPWLPGQPLRYTEVIKPYRSRMHRILYGLLLLAAGATVLNIFRPSVPVIMLKMILQLALLASVILALIKQDETDLKPALKSLTWGVGGYLLVNALVGYVILLSTINTQHTPATQWAFIQTLAALQPMATPWWLDLLVISAVISAALSLWGNLLLGKHWRDKAAAPPAVTAPPPTLT